MTNDAPSVCLIGVTGFGRVHYNDLVDEHRRGRMRLRAVTVWNPDECPEQVALLRRLGCEIFDDWRAMLDACRGQCQLGFIPTGIHWHRPMTIAALEAGMNVFVEKPVAATVQDVRAMQAAERASGRWVAVGYQSMYAAEMPFIKETILSGRLGRLRSVKCYALWPRNDAYYARTAWAGRLRLGDDWILDSPFHNALAHRVNMGLFLAGRALAGSAEPARVKAELYRARPIESCDTAAARIETREGISVSFWLTHVPDDGAAHEGPVLEARCDRGRLLWRLDPGDGAKNRLRIESEGEVIVDMPSESGFEGTPLRLAIMDRLRAKLVDPSAFAYGLAAAGAEVVAANAIHDAVDPADFPAESVSRVGTGPETRWQVKGLSGLIRRAFDEGKLFSEMGVPWAVAGAADAAEYAAGRRDFPARALRKSPLPVDVSR